MRKCHFVLFVQSIDEMKYICLLKCASQGTYMLQNVSAGGNGPALQGQHSGQSPSFKKRSFFKISRPEAMRQRRRRPLRAELFLDGMDGMACQSMPNCIEIVKM